MVDIGFGGSTPLPPSTAQPLTSANNANAQAAAGTVQANALLRPDQVVTATGQGADTNTRNEDALQSGSRGQNLGVLNQQTRVPTIEEATENSVQTDVTLETESGKVFFQFTINNQEVWRIPSEESLQFLRNLNSSAERNETITA